MKNEKKVSTLVPAKKEHLNNVEGFCSDYSSSGNGMSCGNYSTSEHGTSSTGSELDILI
ncbi:hypothetical protein [Sphingobacterium multivorum]|uniref:hypothetical protein n=1 Tax=Sphingobacterium multivorum TaxID=28454 RepID=UPI0028A9F996|nr:hypothetical protein [Sphingobacterium multivorum]